MVPSNAPAEDFAIQCTLLDGTFAAVHQSKLRRSSSIPLFAGALISFVVLCFATRARSEEVFASSAGNIHPTGGTSFTISELGNEVTLAGTDRRLSSIQVLFNPQNIAMTADFTFRFYANDGLGGSPGTLLGQSAPVTGVHLSGQYYSVGTSTFLNPIDLRDSVTWTVQISNATSVACGLPVMAAPPAIGQNVAAWFGSPSGGWATLDGPPLFEAELFTTASPSLMIGDLTGDGLLTGADLTRLEQALPNLDLYGAERNLNPDDVRKVADVNRDGAIDNADVQAEIYYLSTGNLPGPLPGVAQAVLEPGTIVILTIGALGLVAGRRARSNAAAFPRQR